MQKETETVTKRQKPVSMNVRAPRHGADSNRILPSFLLLLFSLGALSVVFFKFLPEGGAEESIVRQSPIASAERSHRIPSQPSKIMDKSPSSPDPTVPDPALVDQYLANGEWQEAEHVLKTILAAYPNNEKALIQMAQIELNQKQDPNAARWLLEKALTLNPNNRAVMEKLLSIYDQTGLMDEGLTFLRSLNASTQEGKSIVEFGIAQSLSRLGKADEAVGYYLKARDDPSSDQNAVRRELVDAYTDSGRPEEAVSILENFDTSSLPYDDFRDLELKLAKAYFRQGREADSRNVLKEWIKRYPNDPVIPGILANLTEAYGEKSESGY
jgi:predicted Zn-dependent protease